MTKQERLAIALAFVAEVAKSKYCSRICPNRSYRKTRKEIENKDIENTRDNFCHYLFPELKPKQYNYTMSIRGSYLQRCGPCPCLAVGSELYPKFKLTEAEIMEKVYLLIENEGD